MKSMTLRAKGYADAALRAFRQSGYDMDTHFMVYHVNRGGREPSRPGEKPGTRRPGTLRPDVHIARLRETESTDLVAEAGITRNPDRTYTVVFTMYYA